MSKNKQKISKKSKLPFWVSPLLVLFPDIIPIKKFNSLQRDLFRFFPSRRWAMDDLLLIRGLAKGGGGVLYHSIYQGQHTVAKIPNCQSIRQNTLSEIESIRQESEIYAKLPASRHIPRQRGLKEFFIQTEGDIRKVWCAIIEYVNGIEIHRLFNKKNLLKKEIKQKITWELVDTLTDVHTAGVVHKDLNPGNILVDICYKTQTLKNIWLIDFGPSQHGQRFVPAYGSPEQHLPLDPDDVGEKSDIFSLGLILFELWEGRLPFLIQEAVKTICSSSEFHLDFSQHTDAYIQGMITEMLRKKPEDRFGSMQDISIFMKNHL